jgi:alpha-L-rhamnosidase
MIVVHSPQVMKRSTPGQHLVSVLALVLAIAVVVSQAWGAQGSLAPACLRCEFADNPLGVDVGSPRLSWKLESTSRAEEQTSFQILVASTPGGLAEGKSDLWDSGRVFTNQSLCVSYRGQPLKSSQPAFWKVRVWDKAGRASAWSKPAKWEMGLLSPQNWQAQWLNDGKFNPKEDTGFYEEDPVPLFRKEFTLPKKVARARLFVSGLGYYEASLNGKRVGDRGLDPGWTRYSERALYSTYDVTSQVRRGANCIGILLGNGWYNPLPLRLWGHLNLREHLPVGRPRFIARLEIELADGTREAVVSDSTWKVADGPIRFNSIYLGEIYDARREVAGWDRAGFDDSGWGRPEIAIEPIGLLRAQSQPPIRVTKTLKPVQLSEPRPGRFVFDFGQNFAGWVNLRVSAAAGARVLLRYGELLNPDGTLNPMTSVAGQIKGTHKTADGREESVGGPGAPAVAWQSDTYVTKGEGMESYTPRFTFHSFRYVEVSGLPSRPSRDAVTGLRLNADVERVGSFQCSSDQFNRIQQMCDWTFLSGLFSVQSDCPHRERFAYGGDLAVTSEAFMMNYDMATFYAKAVRDWKDSAKPDGMLTDTAPFVGIQYCGIAWAMAHPLVQRQLYQYYGDRQLIEEQYEIARRWLELEVRANPNCIVEDGLSDHEGLAAAPAPVMVTPLFAASARTLGELAAILGREPEAQEYGRLFEQVRKAYVSKYLDQSSGKVGPGSQASQAFALYLGLVPEEQRVASLQFLLDDIRRRQDGHLTTGIFGTKFMLDVLSRAGQTELASTIVNQKTYPGWGYMLQNGATTLWEHWKGSDNTYSLNHPMFGSVSEWFYHWLGGIQPAPEAVGFDRILIRPQMVKDLNWVRCSYNSIRGKIVSNWKHDGDRLRMEVEIPANTTALVYVPADAPNEVKEGGKPAADSRGVQLVKQDGGQAIFQIGSGHYVFERAQQFPKEGNAK